MASSPRIEELRKKFEDNPRRYFAPLANEYRKAGDVQQAIAICREYLPQQPGHMSGHIVFGQALYEARSFEEAKAVFETALSLDPENLIALRHLGDIALILNDTEGARGWYKRVLEADPRNEEIQAQLVAIDNAAGAAATPAPASEAATPAADAVRPTPSSTAETVVIDAVKIPPPKPVVTATSPTAEVNVASLGLTGHQQPAPEHQESAPAAVEGLEATAVPADASAGGFSLDGLETTSLAAERSSPPPAATLADLERAPEPPAASGVAGLDLVPTAHEPELAPPIPTLELDVSLPLPSLSSARTVEVRPVSDAAPPALDLDLGSLGTPPVAAESSPPPDIPEAAPLDLDISLPSGSGGDGAPDGREPVRDEPMDVAPPEPVAPVMATAMSSEPAIAPVEFPSADATAPDDEPAAPEVRDGPFLTETMAELYLRQGHRDEALRVYKALQSQRPMDATLRAKIDELEGPASLVAVGGPPIREVLAAIAARRPGVRQVLPVAEAPPVAAPPVEFAPPSAAADAPPRTAAMAEPPRQDVLAPSLGFGDATDGDQGAALVLARAFARNGSGAAEPAGAPARRASKELTLKSVFRDEPPPAPPSSFSFDQFFSQRAADPAAETAGARGGTESPEEVAQFTQWLEGLKKR